MAPKRITNDHIFITAMIFILSIIIIKKQTGKTEIFQRKRKMPTEICMHDNDFKWFAINLERMHGPRFETKKKNCAISAEIFFFFYVGMSKKFICVLLLFRHSAHPIRGYFFFVARYECLSLLPRNAYMRIWEARHCLVLHSQNSLVIFSYAHTHVDTGSPLKRNIQNGFTEKW